MNDLSQKAHPSHHICCSTPPHSCIVDDVQGVSAYIRCKETYKLYTSRGKYHTSTAYILLNCSAVAVCLSGEVPAEPEPAMALIMEAAKEVVLTATAKLSRYCLVHVIYPCTPLSNSTPQHKPSWPKSTCIGLGSCICCQSHWTQHTQYGSCYWQETVISSLVLKGMPPGYHVQHQLSLTRSQVAQHSLSK